jgi:hypothetical protein
MAATPYFSGWPDTLQLNYANPATQDALIAELVRIGGQCDGLRCDMAMLVLPEIFEKTWGRRPPPFWEKAIQTVRGATSGILFYGGSVLGHGMDHATAGVRFRL